MPTYEGFDASKREFLKFSVLMGASRVAAETENVVRTAQLGIAGLTTVSRIIGRARAQAVVESTHNVKFQTNSDKRLWLEQVLRPRGIPVPGEWDLGRINLADECLDLLPAHLTDDEHDNSPLIILLSHENKCCSDYKFLPDTISVDYRGFRPDTPTSAKCIIAHEATHLYFKRTRLMYSDLESKLEGLLQEDRRYFGLRFIDNLDVDRARAEEVVAVIKKTGAIEDARLSKEEEDKYRFITSLFWGLRDPNEFIATMSESYILGTEYFMHWCSYYFSLPVAQRLYDYQKKTVFKGREY